ncbi:RTA1 like protein-domain-containing protein [Rhodotorula diobovata]|uniref:RTA1 like protein-domain-containing protein n=1 Tax=Rhodotorula diobovata TaxID=5288 RepID=A0A5C5G2A8_9BASI|nr:RTA1 like protein-domain-containing protein [Rhodotorula diobovata]
MSACVDCTAPYPPLPTPTPDNGELDFNIYGYDPSLAAAIVFLVAFGLITLWQAGLVVRSRIWWLTVLVVGGLGEIIGWAGRAWAAKDPYSLNAFLTQQICLILAPCFFSATCYGILGMVVRALGRQYSVLRPSLYLWIFCVADLVAIVVQAIGGAMAALALQDGKSSESGTHIMVAGIAFQLACMIAFSGLALDVYRRARRDRSYRSRPHAQEGRLTRVGWGLAWATGWIIVRGIYRTVELAEGWTGYLITHEPYFAVLDSMAMVLCQAVFCVAWPAKERPVAVERRESHDSQQTAAPPSPARGSGEKKVQSV